MQTNLKILVVLACLSYAADGLSAVSAWQELELINGRVFLEVEINGVPARALLDSGASSISVSQGFLDEHGVEYKLGSAYTVVGVHGEMKRRLIRRLDLGMFGAQIPIRSVGSFPSSRKFDMVIGQSFFELFILQIDYPNQRMRYITRDVVDLKALANVEIEKRKSDSMLVAPVSVDGDEFMMLLDTGATAGLVFDRRYAEKRGWIDAYAVGAGRVSGVVETIETTKLLLPVVQFGPYDIADVRAIVPSDATTSTNYGARRDRAGPASFISGGSKYVGILGGDILSNFIVTIDAKKALMHIVVPQIADAANKD